MRYVFALGGNAFNKRNLKTAVKAIVALHEDGDEVVITHGNGPQVGELYLKEGKNLGVLTRETEQQLGDQISRAVSRFSGGKAKVSVVLTRTIVRRNDLEFKRPTKPIGGFYKTAESVPTGNRGFEVKKLERGYRLVVPSPRPMEIVEVGRVSRLLSEGRIVIAAGGGGSSVFRSGKSLKYADAVIDKDLASSLLAVKIGADRLFILTNVDFAYTDFGGKNQKRITRMEVKQAERYLREGHFEEGSMKPKVEACIEFVRKRHGAAAIGNIAKIEEVISLRSTVVLP